MTRAELIAAGKDPDEVGIAVTCAVCGRTKKPWGRSVPLGLGAYYCEPRVGDLPGGCEGYDEEPYVGSLWPGETREEFGHFIL